MLITANGYCALTCARFSMDYSHYLDKPLKWLLCYPYFVPLCVLVCLGVHAHVCTVTKDQWVPRIPLLLAQLCWNHQHVSQNPASSPPTTSGNWIQALIFARQEPCQLNHHLSQPAGLILLWNQAPMFQDLWLILIFEKYLNKVI